MIEKIGNVGHKEEKPKAALIDIFKYQVKHTDQVPMPDIILSINGSMVWTSKNISCSSGKAKGGKTALIKRIVKAILRKGKDSIFECYLKQDKDKILWIDTEQNVYHITYGMKQMCEGLNNNQIERLLMFTFDTLGTMDIQEYTKTLLYSIDGVALAVFDGIADMVYDSNDLKETSNFIRDMRLWATERDIHIHNLIHENPTESNNKMKGHLGTKLADKSECVFSIAPAKDDDELRVVTNPQSRNKKCKPFSFRITDEGIEIEDENYEAPKTGRKPAKVWTNQERYSVFLEAYSHVKKSEGLGYTVLLERTKQAIKEPIGVNALKEFINYAKEMKWTCQDVPRGNYYLYDFVNE